MFRPGVTARENTFEIYHWAKTAYRLQYIYKPKWLDAAMASPPPPLPPIVKKPRPLVYPEDKLRARFYKTFPEERTKNYSFLTTGMRQFFLSPCDVWVKHQIQMMREGFTEDEAADLLMKDYIRRKAFDRLERQLHAEQAAQFGVMVEDKQYEEEIPLTNRRFKILQVCKFLSTLGREGRPLVKEDLDPDTTYEDLADFVDMHPEHASVATPLLYLLSLNHKEPEKERRLTPNDQLKLAVNLVHKYTYTPFVEQKGPSTPNISKDLKRIVENSPIKHLEEVYDARPSSHSVLDSVIGQQSYRKKTLARRVAREQVLQRMDHEGEFPYQVSQDGFVERDDNEEDGDDVDYDNDEGGESNQHKLGSASSSSSSSSSSSMKFYDPSKVKNPEDIMVPTDDEHFQDYQLKQSGFGFRSDEDNKSGSIHSDPHQDLYLGSDEAEESDSPATLQLQDLSLRPKKAFHSATGDVTTEPKEGRKSAVPTEEEEESE